ncbi:coil containing protein [Vibrio phage 1.086.O._10N.222.51.F8]|nr:coil containing protein [Vibrio phage 1.086.O._10N.222.51.F8]
MAYSPSEKYPGAVDVDPDYQGGKFRDNNPSTTNNGSPLKAVDRNELLARDEAIMNDAGFEYSGMPDTPQDSQLFKAYKASLGNGANLLSNHNFLIQTPDDSQPLPSATPTSYPPGYQIFSGVFANETTGITNLTYIDGRVSLSGGDLYFSVPNTGAIARLTSDQLTASVADFDGKPRTRGVSFALVGDEYRVTVGIDALEDASATATPLGSVKFEQGSVATGHETESLSSRNLPDYTDIVYKSSGGNSAFENMVAGNPVAAKVGQIVSTGSARWEKVSENGDASDFFGKYLQNKPANPLDFGIKYGTGKGQSEREDNTGNLQIAFDNCDSLEWAGITETYGQLVVRSSQKLSSKNSANSGIRGFHPTEATITDGTINQPDDINNNTSGVILENIQIQSANSDAIHVTPFKWQLNHSRIQAPNGKGFRYHAGGCQVENRFLSTEFKNCGEGIYNGGGAYSATDQFIESCVFENAGILGHAVNMRLPSGLTHKDNHYFGGALYEFVKFTGGINCNSTDNYYEQMDNPRMWLDGGNPQSWKINDKFWGGNGLNTDYNGDQSSLIRLTVQPFSRMGMVFNSIFDSGTNECPIFSLVDANDSSSLGGVEVQFGKNNVLSGSYSKFNQTVSPLGCGNIIQSDHPSLIQRVDQADAVVTNPNLFRFTGSRYVLYGTGTSTVNSAGMPSSPRWCRDKPLVITNASAANFVLNSPITINGIQTILPGMTVSVMQHPININEYLVEPI